MRTHTHAANQKKDKLIFVRVCQLQAKKKEKSALLVGAMPLTFFTLSFLHLPFPLILSQYPELKAFFKEHVEKGNFDRVHMN